MPSMLQKINRKRSPHSSGEICEYILVKNLSAVRNAKSLSRKKLNWDPKCHISTVTPHPLLAWSVDQTTRQRRDLFSMKKDMQTTSMLVVTGDPTNFIKHLIYVSGQIVSHEIFKQQALYRHVLSASNWQRCVQVLREMNLDFMQKMRSQTASLASRFLLTQRLMGSSFENITALFRLSTSILW